MGELFTTVSLHVPLWNQKTETYSLASRAFILCNMSKVTPFCSSNWALEWALQKAAWVFLMWQIKACVYCLCTLTLRLFFEGVVSFPIPAQPPATLDELPVVLRSASIVANDQSSLLHVPKASKGDCNSSFGPNLLHLLLWVRGSKYRSTDMDRAAAFSFVCPPSSPTTSFSFAFSHYVSLHAMPGQVLVYQGMWRVLWIPSLVIWYWLAVHFLSSLTLWQN